jgi:DUF1680 family protein
MKNIKVVTSTALMLAAVVASFAADYPISPVAITNVAVTGGFWLPRFETNRVVTIESDFKNCEKARIPNFKSAAKREWGKFKGIPFDDSDVFKVIEGAAYSLATHPDAKLKAYVDDLIDWIAKAQEPDGYLYAARTLGFRSRMMGPVRWSNLDHSHELYNAGHLIEGAVAYWEATGERKFLDVAVKIADLIDRTFGPGPTQLKGTSGHEEIELALCKLYRATNEERYLNLAKHLLDVRGISASSKKGLVFTQKGTLSKEGNLGANKYCQAHLPVVEQREAVGHAVRAVYLYCGMADVSALTGNSEYVKAIDAIWHDVAFKKLHLNGSVGASPRGEAFGGPYDLPNEKAYLETCAGIGYALWNQRMFLRDGDAKYIDLIERGIYNGILSGVSLGGDEFFYPNPMASRGGYRRSKWFSCSCCPVNVVRFIPQIAQFAYAMKDDAAYINLFLESKAALTVAGKKVTVSQKTDYPWSGKVKVTIDDIASLNSKKNQNGRFKLLIRVPGWCVGRPVPSDLYTQVESGNLSDFKVKVNGAAFKFTPEKGYCVLEREWKAGDAIELDMNMPVRRIKAHDNVEADKGRLAIERGPILYCAEGVDNGGTVLEKIVERNAKFTDAKCNILGNIYPALEVAAKSVRKTFDGAIVCRPSVLKLIPYFAWCHRGANQMQTWFPVEPVASEALPDFDVKASHSNPNDGLSAIWDGILPSSSFDYKIPRHTFWPNKGTDEWIEIAFPENRKVKGVSIYWYDDTGHGQCRVPQSWNVQSRSSADAKWTQEKASYPVSSNKFCTANFESEKEVQSLRVNIKLKKEFSAGILELRVLR